MPYSGSGTCCDSACSTTTATISWPWWRGTTADASTGMQTTHSTVTAPARKAPHLWHLFLARSSTSPDFIGMLPEYMKVDALAVRSFPGFSTRPPLNDEQAAAYRLGLCACPAELHTLGRETTSE